MPTASQTDAQHRSPRAPRSRAAERRRGALRALLAAFAAVPPHSAFCLWLAPCGPRHPFMAERRR